MWRSSVVRHFEITASIFVVAAMAAVTLCMIRVTAAGGLPLWPYPLFAIFAGLVFVAYWFVSRNAVENKKNMEEP